MMFDFKARLVVVPTVAELELKIAHIFALQRFYKHQTNTIQHANIRQLCKHMKAPFSPSRPWASYKPASYAANNGDH